MSFVTLSAVSILIGIFHIGKFSFWVPFFKKLLLRNYVADFVEICNVCTRKAVIEAAKRIINSDKVCHSYSDFNFGVTFFGTQCVYIYIYILYSIFTMSNSWCVLVMIFMKFFFVAVMTWWNNKWVIFCGSRHSVCVESTAKCQPASLVLSKKHTSMCTSAVELFD